MHSYPFPTFPPLHASLPCPALPYGRESARAVRSNRVGCVGTQCGSTCRASEDQRQRERESAACSHVTLRDCIWDCGVCVRGVWRGVWG